MELPVHRGASDHLHAAQHNTSIHNMRWRVARPLVSIGLLALGILLVIYGVNNCQYVDPDQPSDGVSRRSHGILRASA